MIFLRLFMVRSGLTKKAEPPPTRDVNRDSGTDRANGGWLRQLVRQHRQRVHDAPVHDTRQTNLVVESSATHKDGTVKISANVFPQSGCRGQIQNAAEQNSALTMAIITPGNLTYPNINGI